MQGQPLFLVIVKTGKLEVFRRNSKEVLCGKVPTPYKKAHKTIQTIS